MILLLGGTCETAPLALALVTAGHRVMVSMATDAPIQLAPPTAILRRTGQLDRQGLLALAREQALCAIVNATHPYAAQIRTLAPQVAREAGLPYFSFLRPSALTSEHDVMLAVDHLEAAQLAFTPGRPVLLTTGSRNLMPYVQEARRRQVPLMARVLAHPQSIAACEAAGLAPAEIVAERGPFSTEQTESLLEKLQAGVLVTKDSGDAGGFGEKLAAARKKDCQVIVVQRPVNSETVAFADIGKLVQAIGEMLPSRSCGSLI